MKRCELSHGGYSVAAYLLILTWIVFTPPILYAQEINCPVDPPALPCDVDPVVTITGEPVLLDLCPNPVLSFSDAIIPGDCPNTYAITRTWTVTDDCTNNLSCTQVIQIQDVTAPVITCPPGISIACNVAPTPDITGYATATDACDPALVITYSDEVIPGACPGNYTVIRSWTATDACGNTSVCTQTITLFDDIAPVVFCPANITLECDMPLNPADVGVATAADNCSIDVGLAYSDELVTSTSLERSWIATDECGNTAVCTQVITLTITDCPLKVVPVRFCIFGKGDATANNKRFDKKQLLDGLRKKNELWKQCNVQFKPNKDAVNEVEDKTLPPSGKPGDVLWGDEFKEFNAVMKQCNEAAGKDALEKLTDIFIRSFVDMSGNTANYNGGAYETESCKNKFISSKPLITDPSWGTAERFGTTMAHENGHALSLSDLQEKKDTFNVMYFTEFKGKNKFEDDQCKKARIEAQKISGTTDKDADGKPVTRSAPRTRLTTDDLNPDPTLAWSDIMEYAVTYVADKQLLSLAAIVVAGEDDPGSQYLYRFMLDADNNPNTGADAALLFGFPGSFPGADFYADLLVTIDLEPTVTEQQAFAIASDELMYPVTDFTSDATVYSIALTGPDGSIKAPGAIILQVNVSALLFPQSLVEGFQSATTAERVGDPSTFDASPNATGSITPFEEPTLILLDPVSGTPGSTVSISGEAFTPKCEVEISIDTLVIGSVMTGADGKFNTLFTIPNDISLDGPHSIMAVDTSFAGDVMLFHVVSGTSEYERNNLVLGRNYPNPFTTSTTIPYNLSISGQVLITIRNPLGQVVAILGNSYMPSGEHQVQWTPGPEIPGGIYICQLRAGNRLETQKLIYMKK